MLRPLVIIKDNKPLLTADFIDKISKKLLSWTDLLRMGVIELIDANEEENCNVTLDEKNTKKYSYMTSADKKTIDRMHREGHTLNEIGKRKF